MSWVIAVLVPGVWSHGASETNSARRVQFLEPGGPAYWISPDTTRTALSSARLSSATGESWTLAKRDDGAADAVELSNRIVLELAPDRNLLSYVDGADAVLSRTVLPNLFILQAADSDTAINVAEKLSGKPGVVACYPVMRRPWRLHNAYAKAPNDSKFVRQWNLENRGADHNLAGPDLNVRAAWPLTRGEGVLVAVADDGFQLDHPELTSRAEGGPHFNFYRNRAGGGPASAEANHATAVAGLIAAEKDNKQGVAGVAPGAHLASWVIFGSSFFGGDSIASDEQLMDMFQYSSDRVAVQNHSWGSSSTIQLAIDTLSDAGIVQAIRQGRGGKGVVIVRAAGNQREDLTNANDDGMACDPRAIAVAAVRKDGRACSYSSPGACLLVAAPSGDAIDTDGDGVVDAEDPSAPDVLTTDRTGRNGLNSATTEEGSYTGFNGTSASAPQISGIAALILGANPNLTYRDVQQILIHSARHYDLADPDLRVNGAGFRFSHNVGFGVPDAGRAVELARTWPSRPAARRISSIANASVNIPDDALRVVVEGPGLASALTSIRCLPTLGRHPDDAMAVVPLVYVGLATQELTQDLHGKGALIQRGTSTFADKIARAARAGAAFAVIFNHTGTTEIQPMGGTTFVPIPAVGISKGDGDALRDFLSAHPETTAKLNLDSAVIRFAVADTLICEHVGVRLKTTHTCRADLRITLVSPMGTRSVLQAINLDNSGGPTDWTYWSAQHFSESSAGEWRVEVSDERNTTVRVGGVNRPAIGSVIYAELLVDGVAITDSDRDGLDDSWELEKLGTLKHGPRDDSDGDGLSNAREQAMGTNPAQRNTELRLDFTELAAGFWRLSWPSAEGGSYTLESTGDLGQPWNVLAVVSGRGPVAERVIAGPGVPNRLYRIRAEP